MARHTGGRGVVEPLDLDRRLHDTDWYPVSVFLQDFLPGINPLKPHTHAVCMYTLSPDDHFVVGTDGKDPPVAFAVGMSGHGFKFAPVLGEVLADLATDGVTSHGIGVFDPGRPGVVRLD